MIEYVPAVFLGKVGGQPAEGRLRVLMVCARYLPDVGGVETHVGEVARRLAAGGEFEITVLATDRTRALPRREVVDRINILRVPAWPRNRDYYLSPLIPGVVRCPGRWDIVHCQGIHSPVPALAMIAARKAKLPYLVTFHTGGHSLRHRNVLRPVQWRMIGPLLRDAAVLIGVSRFEADTLSRQAGLCNKSIVVIRNGGSLPPPRAGTTVIPGRIVSSGRLERYKGHHRLIEALPYLIPKVRDAHLVVLGEGPYEHELRRLAYRLHVDDRVTIRCIDPRDRQAMATALAEASVFASLSEYESQGVGIMEALDVGRPVVGSDVAAVAELVDEGWIYGVGAGEPAAGVARQLATAMSSGPLIAPGSLPTWDACADRLRELYLALGNGSGTVPGRTQAG